MADMITLISSLPAQVVGVQVLSFLYLSAIVRLDCAVAHSSYRSVVQEAISFSTVTISSRQHQCLTDQQKLWSWCVERSVVAESVYISVVHAENTVLLEKLLCNVARPYAVRWELIMQTAERDEVYSVINNDTIRNKISTLGLTNHTGNTDFPLFHWEALNRASFHSTSEQSLRSHSTPSIAVPLVTAGWCASAW
jgi:hypothetical protein